VDPHSEASRVEPNYPVSWMVSRIQVTSSTWLMIDYLNGTLWVDEFVTHHQTLEDINKGFDDMHVSTLSLRTQ